MFNEREVVPKIVSGDLKAFHVLVKQYERLVYHVIFKLVDNREDAEDICQEVFMKVFKSLKDFAYQSKLSTWIAKITYTTALNHLKKYDKDRHTGYPENIEMYHFTKADPEHLLIKKDTDRYVNYLMEQMPPQYKIVLSLYHLEEFSYQEIETITGMPEGTIKSYLFRGRKLLKEKLETYLKKEKI